jgi:hypothetical protein
MSESNVQSALSTPNCHFDLVYDRPAELSVVDPGIDDPVNDTGLGPRRGDLELSDEFAGLIRRICEGNGELS